MQMGFLQTHCEASELHQLQKQIFRNGIEEVHKSMMHTAKEELEKPFMLAIQV